LKPTHFNVLRRCVLASLLVLGTAAHSQGWAPGAQPIKLVVPAAPGGSTDILARSLAQILQRQTGVTVIVDNKAGAGGTIGVAAVARAPADGLTVLMTVPDAITVLPSLRTDIPYKVDRDLAPLALVAETNWLFAVNPKHRIKTVQELLSLAAAHPGETKFASPGIGTTAHLITERLAIEGRVQMLHVPYKGAGPAATAAVSGEVDLIASSPITLQGFVNSGQLRPLATTGSTRSAVMPDVPTMVESGFSGFAASAWFGLLAPTGLPANRAEWLKQAIYAAAHDAEFQRQLKQMGLEGRYLGHDEFAKFLQVDAARWREVITATKTKLTE